jgi:hypothetical protein
MTKLSGRLTGGGDASAAFSYNNIKAFGRFVDVTNFNSG